MTVNGNVNRVGQRLRAGRQRRDGLKHVVHSRTLAWQHCGSGCIEFFLQPSRFSLTAIERGYSGCLPKRTLLVLGGKRERPPSRPSSWR